MGSKRFWHRCSAGLILAASAVLMPAADAAAQDGGTITIGPDDAGTPNAPHQGCVLQVEFAGFPADVGAAAITITVIPPSSDPAVLIVEDVFVLEQDPAGGAGDFDGGTSYDVGDILNEDFEPNESEAFHVRVDVDFEPGPPADASKVFWVTCPPPQADLAVTKTGPANSASGSNVSFTLTASNNGPDDAANVSLSDALPAGVTFVSLAQSSGPDATTTTPTPGTSGTVTATWATLADGESASFTLTVNVGAGFTGELLNSAIITATTTDPSPANNTSTASLAITTSTTSTTSTTTTLASTTSTTVASTTSTTLGGGLPATGAGSRTAPLVAIALLGAGVSLVVLASRRRMPNG